VVEVGRRTGELSKQQTDDGERVGGGLLNPNSPNPRPRIPGSKAPCRVVAFEPYRTGNENLHGAVNPIRRLSPRIFICPSRASLYRRQIGSPKR